MSSRPGPRQTSTSSSAEDDIQLQAQIEPFLPSTKQGVLHRNRACHQCRKKKLKCDAQRPHCKACLKAKRTDEAVECTWDEFKIPRRTLQAMRRAEKEKLKGETGMGGKRKRESEETGGSDRPGFQSVSLHANIRGIHSGRDDLSYEASPTMSGGMAGTSGSYPMGATSIWPPVSVRPATEWLYSRGPQDTYRESHQRLGPDTAIPASYHQEELAFNYVHPTPIPGLDLSSMPEPEVDDEWMKVIWPGWSPFLPAPHVVQHFVNVFFNRVHPYSKMIHRASFYQRLGLPPTHPRFPPKVLLHAIVATAARYTSADGLTGAGTHMFALPKGRSSSGSSSAGCTPTSSNDSSGRNSSGTWTEPIIPCPFYPHSWVAPLEHREFADWHYARAAEDISKNVAFGRDLVATMQAQVLLTQSHCHNAAWAQAWSDSGATLRLCPPLGLHESFRITPDDAFGAPLLRPPSNLIEREERSRTFWMAFMLERMVGLTSNFSASMGEDDITVELPIAQDVFEAANEKVKVGQEPSQSLHKGHFYLEHPPEHADSLNLLIKVIRLAATASNFRRQYARQPDKGGISYAEHPLVRMLLHQATAFRLSFPVHLRKPLRDNLHDSDLITATMLCHMITLIVGEPYIDTATWQSDLANRTLVALRSILSMIYDLINTSYDLSLLSSITPLIWLTAARVTLSFAMAARGCGDLQAVEIFMSETGVYKLACEAYGERSCCGLRQASMITDMIELSERTNKEQFARSTGKFIKAPDTERESERDVRYGKALGIRDEVQLFQGTTIDLASFSFESGGAEMSFLGTGSRVVMQ